MSAKETFTYTADDGYAGGARPKHCSVPIDEILACETVDDAVNMIQDFIHEDFANRVTPSYDSQEIAERVKEIFAGKEQE